MKTLEDKMNELSPERRARVEARTQQLRAQLETLDELRTLYAKARDSAAQNANLTAGQIAKAEKDSDALLAALREYVETLGGTLKITAEIPGKEPVDFTSLLDLIDNAGDKN